ncbi:MAG: Flp pilus assembly complex ATPase component TadA [Phycisphaeraceae bacterium]|nr:Flp pilus assembly complex ATPase component TadA [Phycisphaeraceae bacterium]
MDLHTILRAAYEADASDIHLIAGQPPFMRVHQVMTPMEFPAISADDAAGMFEDMAPPEAQETFAKIHDADYSYQVPDLARYRVNAHLQRGAIGMALRMIKTKVPPLSALSLPEVIARLTYLPRGLVLVTGDTGSGKSTTLAAMIQAMNERYAKHVITLEDPVEYVFESDQCLMIEQRELGQDMPTFASGLKLRCVRIQTSSGGRDADLETAAWRSPRRDGPPGALDAAHGQRQPDGGQIIDMYPAARWNQIRSMLAPGRCERR